MIITPGRRTGYQVVRRAIMHTWSIIESRLVHTISVLNSALQVGYFECPPGKVYIRVPSLPSYVERINPMPTNIGQHAISTR